MHLHESQLVLRISGLQRGPRDGLWEVWCGGFNRLWRWRPEHDHVRIPLRAGGTIGKKLGLVWKVAQMKRG